MKRNKFFAALLFIVMTVSMMLFSGCSEKTELTGTYQTITKMSLQSSGDNYDFLMGQSTTLSLYSDGTYVCQIVITEGMKTKAEGSIGTDFMFIPLATTSITRYGTYEITTDTDLQEDRISLSEATRIIYATNAHGGHYALVPDGMLYCDSADEEQAAKFITGWFGSMDDLKAKVGQAVELTASTDNHMINEQIFDYETPLFEGA